MKKIRKKIGVNQQRALVWSSMLVVMMLCAQDKKKDRRMSIGENRQAKRNIFLYIP
jgi:hypothetical protein